MKRDTFELLLGLAVMAVGIGLLLFTFVSALTLAANPGPFLRSQLPGGSGQGPTAAFTWTSNGFNFTVQDTSQQGSAAIARWTWDYGDGSHANGPNPGPHVYADAGPYTVLLTVRDSNDQESTTFSAVIIVPGQTRSGSSVGDFTAGFPSLDFNELLLPVSVGLLTMGLYLAMTLVGGMIAKTGWNLIRPKPETIRIRLKPRHLQQYFEEDATQSSALSAGAMPPPPPPQA